MNTLYQYPGVSAFHEKPFTKFPADFLIHWCYAGDLSNHFQRRDSWDLEWSVHSCYTGAKDRNKKGRVEFF